jgi:hypothetical protein
MDPLDRSRNQSQLVFCRENVDPDFVTQIMGLVPTEALTVGDPTRIWGGPEVPSQVGVWKLDLPGSSDGVTIEDQLARWVDLLRPKTAALSKLRSADYAPYFDCKAEQGSGALCIDPELLSALGHVGVSLSIWLYEGN